MKSMMKVTCVLMLGLNVLAFQNCSPGTLANAGEIASDVPVVLEDSNQQSLMTTNTGLETNELPKVIDGPPVTTSPNPKVVKPQVIVDAYSLSHIVSPRMKQVANTKFPSNVAYFYNGGRMTFQAGCQFSAFQVAVKGFTSSGFAVAMNVPTDIMYNRVVCDALYADISEAQAVLKAANEYQVVTKTAAGATLIRIGSAKAGWVYLKKTGQEKIPNLD